MYTARHLDKGFVFWGFSDRITQDYIREDKTKKKKIKRQKSKPHQIFGLNRMRQMLDYVR